MIKGVSSIRNIQPAAQPKSVAVEAPSAPAGGGSNHAGSQPSPAPVASAGGNSSSKAKSQDPGRASIAQPQAAVNSKALERAHEAAPEPVSQDVYVPETAEDTGNEQIRKAVEQFNKKMLSHSNAIFGIHEETNRVMIKIVDRETKKVIKELPPEKTLDMISKIWEMAGLMVDEKR